MPRSIRQFVITVVATGVAVVGATAIGVAAAQSAFEQAKKTTYRINSPVSETDFRIGFTISSSGTFSLVAIG